MAYSNIKYSSLKHHIYYTYSSHNTHMIHKSFSTTSNYHEVSSPIIVYIKNSFLYNPKLNSQSLMRNRSQQQRKRDILSQHCSLWWALLLAWREITGLSRHGEWISRLAKRYRSLAMASWVARLASDEDMFAVASYDSRLANDVRTEHGIKNFFTKNPNFHHVKPQIRLKC